MKPRADSSALLNRLTLLGDSTRLRILRLLERQELSVGELARALQLPQSTVSRHLKLVHEGEWVIRRNEGTASFFRLVDDALEPEARDLWAVTRAQLGRSPTIAEDDSRLAELLLERREENASIFGRLGSDWDHVRHDLFGLQFTAEALINLINPAWHVADLGCGTGNAAEFLARQVAHVIAVDREPAMLDAARQRLEGCANVEFREGELTQLPIDNAVVDAAVVFLVLHHLDVPENSIAEARRILKPSGVLLIVDMVEHDRESYLSTMGHRHLGFSEQTVQSWGADAGFQSTAFHRLRPAMEARGPGLFAAALRA